MGFLDSLSNLFSTANPVVGVSQGTIQGLFSTINSVIEEFHLPPAQELAAKQKLLEMKTKAMEDAYADTASARQMLMATKSKWPGLLSIITLVGYFGAGWYVIKYGLPATSADGRDVILLWMQTLVSGVTLVYGFWLGSSHSSQQKDVIYGSKNGTNPASTTS